MKYFFLGGVAGLLIGYLSGTVISTHNAADTMKTESAGGLYENKSHSHDDETMDTDHSHGEDTDMQAHDMEMVSPTAPVPTVRVEAVGDTKDGYNVEIVTTNFAFTPETVNEEVVQNTGHAHIYVNGEKIARVYSNWFHLSGELFADGENEIMVTLNANNHGEWAIDGTSITNTITVTKRMH